LQPWLIARGLGLGLLNLPLQNLALSVVSNKAMAKASSLVNATRQIFAAVGLALLTTYLTQQATSNGTSIGNDIKAGLATHQFSGTALTCVQASGPTGNQALIQKCVMQYATVSGLTSTFWIVLGVCAVTIVLALIAGRDPAIEAYKAAKARGEDVKLERQAVLSE
jgi:DHA2 family multidrug resistance protein